MKKPFVWMMVIGALNLLLFAGVFRVLQEEKIYKNTLGFVSQNYERTGSWGNYQVQKVSRPYITVTNENLLSWDAPIYKCISERMYRAEEECYGNVRAAFFPLFPLMWRWTGASAIGISIINYLIFIFSLALLVNYLYPSTLTNKLIAFTLLITLPSVISYHIPYSESLFLLTMTLAAIGLLKKRYWLYFAGSLLLAIVRPATVFVLIAIIAVEFFALLRHRNFLFFVKEGLVKSIPFLAGYLIAIFLQYYYSGSWDAIFMAREFWAAEIFFTRGFSDWSVEGFGLSAFAMVFLILPAACFTVWLIVRMKNRQVSNFMDALKNYREEYLFMVSLFYLIGIFAFTLATQGLNLHSFSRYALASPLFYIAVLFLLDRSRNWKMRRPTIIYLALALLFALFLVLEDFGGSRLQFPFFGAYMFILSGFFLLLKRKLSPVLQISFLVILILLNTLWNTYLLNIFISDGWIFT